MRNQALGAILGGTICVAILVGMLVQHGWPLWTGSPIHLRVRPVDPRDLFRGDYVILDYPAQRLTITPDRAATSGEETGQSPRVRPIGNWWQRSVPPGTVLYVQFKPEPSDIAGVEQIHVPVSVSQERQPGAVNVRGVLRSLRRSERDSGLEVSLRMHYGIDALFVQEGTGKPIEEAIRDRDRAVVAEVMVTESGAARLKSLIVDGERVGD